MKGKKLVLSNNSALVCNCSKVGHRIAKELNTYGISVELKSSNRDIGIMFTGGKHRDASLKKTRFKKGSSRNT